MSYSISAKGSAKDIFRSFGAFDQAVFKTFPDGPSPEVVDHLFVGKTAAAESITSGVFGDPDSEFVVVVSGHANPEHQPKEGWVNDCISISITQLSSPKALKPSETDGVLVN